MNELEEKAFRLRDKLLEKGLDHYGDKRWNQLIAAMDNIEDAAVGLEFFAKGGVGSTPGEKYLKLFGALQLIYSQQDSFSFIYRVMSDDHRFDHEYLESWNYLRDLRNRVFGHPAGNGGAVSRITIESESFTVAKWDEAQGKLAFEEVDFRSHLSRYRQEIGEQIDALVSQPT